MSIERGQQRRGFGQIGVPQDVEKNGRVGVRRWRIDQHDLMHARV